MPYVQVRGLRFHVQRSGVGPDVALIHGLTGDLSTWMLSRTFQRLAETRRVTAYDLRGHGYSEVAHDGYDSAEGAADLFAILDDLGVERADLVGHSFGAVIALHAAVSRPERVGALVLSDPYFPALRHLEDASRWGHWRSFRQEALDAGVALADEHWYDLGRFFEQVRGLDDEALLKLRRAVGLPAMSRLLKLAATTCGVDAKSVAGLTTDRMIGVRRPVLALYGEHSPFLATADYLVDHLPDCRKALVRAAKHRAPQENPDEFAGRIVEFLDGLTSASRESA